MRTIVLLIPLLAVACTQSPELEDPIEDVELADDGKADGQLTANAKVVYLNFSGVTLQQGDCDDATRNCTNMVMWSRTTVPAFDASPYGARTTVINKIVADVRRYFRGLDIRFTTTRPTSGAYRMVMVGGKALDIMGLWVMGRSHINCAGDNGNAIAFVTPVFDGRSDNPSILDAWAGAPGLDLFKPPAPDPQTQVWNAQYYDIPRAIAHELGHTFGLLHTMGFSASNPGPPDMMCEHAECRNVADYAFHEPPMTIEGGQGDCGASTQSSLGILRDHIGVTR
jgi:hypothetical protein